MHSDHPLQFPHPFTLGRMAERRHRHAGDAQQRALRTEAHENEGDDRMAEENRITEDMLPKEGEEFPENLNTEQVVENGGLAGVKFGQARKVETTDFNNPNQKVNKLVIEVEHKSFEGTRGYWPNKTSIKNLADALGPDFSKWKGATVDLGIAKVNVPGKGMRDAVFVDPKSIKGA